MLTYVLNFRYLISFNLLNMNIQKIVSISLFSLLLFSNTTFAAGTDGIELRGGQRPPMNMELPDDWEDMTEEEQREYMEENHPKEDVKKAVIRSYAIKALKAENYKTFTGTLKEAKEFTDKTEIKNLTAVQFLQQRGILEGYSDGSFGPEKSINRAESLKVLLEALGEGPDTSVISDFSDVDISAWFAGYVSKAKRLGIVKGYTDGTFKPGKTVGQAELLKIAFESFGVDLSDYEVTDLPSEADVNAWYAVYLQYAIDNNLLDLEDVDLASGMTREQFSELIYRLIQQQEELLES